MLSLRHCIQEYAQRADVDGIVVTHGTDTLEETAYFLDCTVQTSKPIVIIGAMRNSSEPDWDGPRNLRDGILLASDPKAQNLGVLVCLANQIHAASEVSKVDTSTIDTFASLDFGQLGRIVNGTIFIYRRPVHRDYFDIQEIPRYVPIISCYTSSESFLLQSARTSGADAIVIEAMGVGNVPPPVFQEIKKKSSSGDPHCTDITLSRRPR